MSATVDVERRDCAVSVQGGPTTAVDIAGRRIGRAGTPQKWSWPNVWTTVQRYVQQSLPPCCSV
jgi:hypothetical protein